MKRSKNQAPKTKEAPSSKNQRASVSYLTPTRRDETDGVLDWALNEGVEDSGQKPHPFDLEERTAKFGERIIRFVKQVPRGPLHPENNRLVDQLVGAGTSVGANYCEANDCVSRKDFKFTIKRCIKEAKEARFFCRMIAASEPTLSGEARALYREATEFVRIFATMHSK